MNGVFDPKSPNFLGGNNVHHLVIIGLLTFLVVKAAKK
jgi:hypothetical protein